MNTQNTSGFRNWILTLIDEKGLDLEERLIVQGPSGQNSIPLGCLVDAMASSCLSDREQIKAMIVKLDFKAAPLMPFFKHLAQAIAK